jgi:radical SAM protein with 4Fe4S-binding SPASM domain
MAAEVHGSTAGRRLYHNTFACRRKSINLSGSCRLLWQRDTVAQCDCWVTSYPESFFGNMFREPDLTRMLRESPARREFVERPKHLVEHEDCLSCRYLSICHGGCPVRTYSALGTMLAKDPYCEVYKAVFGRAETHARNILRSRLVSDVDRSARSRLPCKV